jgi:chlorobactene glucosyltransferase
MIGAGVALFWAVMVTWLICRAARQYRAYEVLQPQPLSAAPPVIDVVVPARDEADAIARCLEGLAAQDYPCACRTITVVDDGSRDATAAIAREIAAGREGIRVIEAGGLPPGWTGKAHACWQGAIRGCGRWLCFIDADTVPRPALLRSAVAAAEARGLALLSLEPRQELVTAWERLIIPAGLCALGFVGDLRRTGDAEQAATPANGQFLLIRRDAYERAGGHAAVRGEVAEDSALASRIKAAGGGAALAGGAPLIAVRMYRSLPQLWEGLGKNVTETFGGVSATIAASLTGLVLAWSAVALPASLALAFAASPSALGLAALALAALASLAMLALHVAAARYLGIPFWYGAIFPLGYTLAVMLASEGIAARRRGRIAWKGRVYSVPRRAE